MVGAAQEAIAYYAIRASQPIVVRNDWSVDHTLTGFAERISQVERSPLTPRTYAIEGEVFARFLRQRYGKELREVEESDLWAYRNERLDGPMNVRLERSSWNKIAAVILRLLRHLKITFPELNWKSYSAGKGGGTVRMVSLDHYLRFRNDGLMARRNALRNGAFGETLVTTGLRCNEASHLLKREVPSLESFGSYNSRTWAMPATICKGEKPRSIVTSKRVIRDYISAYMREERSGFVQSYIQRRFQNRAYSLRDLDSMSDHIFFNMISSSMAEVIGGASHQKRLPLAEFTVYERERLIEVARTSGRNLYSITDLGPLWLSETGTCVNNSSWRSEFSAAFRYAGLVGIADNDITPHVLRHSFAVYMLKFMLLGLLELRAKRGALDRRGEVYDMLVGDPLNILQQLLGHSSISTTYKYLRFNQSNSELVARAFDTWDTHMALTT